MRKYFYCLFAFAITLVSCDQEEIQISPKGKVVEKVTSGDTLLVDSTKIIEFNQPTLSFLITQTDFADMADLIQYGVEIYRITYLTNYKGATIEASGLVVLPKNPAGPIPVASVHHGTIFSNDQAPSTYSLTNPDVSSQMEFLGAAGYAVFFADYIGFGESSELLHPYYNKEHTVSAVEDMIRVGKSFAGMKGLDLTDELFLFGYSEGGYVTMAVQEHLEALNDPELQVTASALGSGGYNLTTVMDEIIFEDSYPNPNYLGYITYSYHVMYEWDKPLTYYFDDPVAEKIPSLYDGTNSGNFINSELPNELGALFDTCYLVWLRDKTEPLMPPALVENSVHDWVPAVPIRMYHGTSDAVVPFTDTQQTYDGFISRGATSVDLVTLQDATHGNSLVPMVKDAIPWFQSFLTQ